jgi:hypothetical protein
MPSPPAPLPEGEGRLFGQPLTGAFAFFAEITIAPLARCWGRKPRFSNFGPSWSATTSGWSAPHQATNSLSGRDVKDRFRRESAQGPSPAPARASSILRRRWPDFDAPHEASDWGRDEFNGLCPVLTVRASAARTARHYLPCHAVSVPHMQVGVPFSRTSVNSRRMDAWCDHAFGVSHLRLQTQVANVRRRAPGMALA